jgi:hypothetical protein
MGKEINCREHGFMLFPPLKKTFDIFWIHLKPLETKKFLLDKRLH